MGAGGAVRVVKSALISRERAKKVSVVSGSHSKKVREEGVSREND